MNDKSSSSLFPHNEPVVGVLTHQQIESAIAAGKLISSPTFQSASLEASSYDISVGRKVIVGGQGTVVDLTAKGAVELEPGAYAGVISHERLHLPSNICARIGSKRTMSYSGLILLTGSVVDPGYEGHLLFGLYNASQRRAFIRTGQKICNIVFEKLPITPEKQAHQNPHLLVGDFPDEFIDRMANMDVLPWMQISERVKQIETITKDILDLKARYDDVLDPIRDLTENVQSLTNDVTSLTAQTKAIAKDVESVNSMVGQNNQQINTLTTNMTALVGQVQSMQDRTRRLEDAEKIQTETVLDVRARLGRFQLLVYIFWGLLLVALGAGLSWLLPWLFNRP